MPGKLAAHDGLAVLVMDKNGFFIDAVVPDSPAFDLTAGQIIDTCPDDMFVDPADVDRYHAAIAYCLDHGHPIECQFATRAPDGTVRDHPLRMMPTGDGTVVGYYDPKKGGENASTKIEKV
jgi:hypothetical protein